MCEGQRCVDVLVLRGKVHVGVAGFARGAGGIIPMWTAAFMGEGLGVVALEEADGWTWPFETVSAVDLCLDCIFSAVWGERISLGW